LAGRESLTCHLRAKSIPRGEKRPWRRFWLLSSGMARATLKHLVEDAELRVQRAQNRLDRQRQAVAALERADRDAAKAKRYLRILEKALAIHVADRDRLATRAEKRP
jgi:hypothetical protein